MSSAFWAGLLAGYGIAVPVGAIAILIIETGLQRGFAPAFMAGAGAATADLVYATLAAVAGTALAVFLAPVQGYLQIASGAVLIFLGCYGLYRLWRAAAAQVAPQVGPQADAADAPIAPADASWRIYGQFLALTLLNPATVAYFAALILGMRAGQGAWEARLAFVAGAALASLSWQSFLAGLSALGGRRLSPRFRALTSIVGNLIIVALGLRVMLAF